MKIEIELQSKSLILFDIEYDNEKLVQIALLIFKNIRKNIFKLEKSINLYIKQPILSKFFVSYTGITEDILNQYGLELNEVQQLINQELQDLDLDNSCVVSHGVKNDLKILSKNGIKLNLIKQHECTYNLAKKILKRENKLSLEDIAEEACYQIFNAHNAYADVWATLYSYLYLKEIEKDNASI